MAPSGDVPLDPRVMQLLLPRPAATTAPPTDAELRLSDFEKVGNLGEGTCGQVTKVRHRGTTALYALKTAHYAVAAADVEAEALRRGAGSPHVVRCHAVLRVPSGELGVVLELMDAGSLDSVLRRRRGRGFPEPALADVAARCLAGLAHLHSRGVAHLDIKPANLLASTRGAVKIGDFSVSQILSDPGDDASISVGQAAYMSPERFAPNARAGWPGAFAADVWGLGMTVLELLLGRCPILHAGDKPTWVKLMRAICHGEPPSVPQGTAASAELRGFVAACLRKDPRRRATVRQLLAHPFVARRDAEASRRALRELIVQSM